MKIHVVVEDDDGAEKALEVAAAHGARWAHDDGKESADTVGGVLPRVEVLA